MGSPANDGNFALALDADQNIYMAGFTYGSLPTTTQAAVPNMTSTTVPGGSPFQMFAAKLSADGSRFLYITYLPDDLTNPTAIAIDPVGNAYVTGNSSAGEVWVIKINPTGTAFGYRVVLGGSYIQRASSLAIDSAGNLLVAGETMSVDFPVTTGAIQSKLRGSTNVFLTKLDPSGRVLLSTYLGGSGQDSSPSVALDASDNIFVAMVTTSKDLRTTAGAFQPHPAVPLWAVSPGGFVAKLTPDASTLLYGSYVTTVGNPLSIAVTSTGDTYLAGMTGTGMRVTRTAPQPCFTGAWHTSGVWDAFAFHLDPQGVLQDATYLGTPLRDGVLQVVLQLDRSVLLVTRSDQVYSTSKLHFGDSGSIAPNCLSPVFLNSATLQSSTTFQSSTQSFAGGVAPGEIITLTGVGIGPDAGASYQADSQGLLPRLLGGVTVLFDGVPAPLLYAQSNQINLLVPYELAGHASTTVQLQYNNAAFGPVTVPITYADPGILRTQPGISEQAFAINEDGSVNGPDHPALKGSVIALWGTGFGAMTRECTTGGINAPGPVPLAPGNFLMPPGPGSPIFSVPGAPSVGVLNLEYAGGAPGKLCGVQQVNLRIPLNYYSGEVAISLASRQILSPSADGELRSWLTQNRGLATIFVK